jgi:membrane-associated phospholipid phosphatase
VLNLRPDRRKWTLELLHAALRLANYAQMRFKHALACRRPLEYSPQVQPMILTPGHGALPSGHATEAHIVALVLWNLVRSKEPTKPLEWLEQLMRQAARVAINRTVAGVHFPVDSAAGQLLGLTLGAYFLARATAPAGVKANYSAFKFDGTAFDNTGDFDWRKHYNVYATGTSAAETQTKALNAGGVAFADQMSNSPQSAGRAPLLAELWSMAQGEWP